MAHITDLQAHKRYAVYFTEGNEGHLENCTDPTPTIIPKLTEFTIGRGDATFKLNNAPATISRVHAGVYWKKEGRNEITTIKNLSQTHNLELICQESTINLEPGSTREEELNYGTIIILSSDSSKPYKLAWEK